MYSITWRGGLCSNPLHRCIRVCIRVLGGEVTALSLLEPTALHGCIPLFGGEDSVRTHCIDVFEYLAGRLQHFLCWNPLHSVRTHCMDVFHYLAVRLHHVSLLEPTALHGCIPLLGGEVTARFSVRGSIR